MQVKKTVANFSINYKPSRKDSRWHITDLNLHSIYATLLNFALGYLCFSNISCFRIKYVLLLTT